MTQIIPFSTGPARERFAPTRRIRIGLVNNMPDAALEATERQFRRLLTAAGGEAVDLRLFHLPEIARGPAARDHLRTHYAGLDELMRDGIDALVVTGCEPKTAQLSDEPYWASLAKLVEWARTGTVSTLWSCLAAHAAVLHLDGIERRLLPEKAAGIFSCARVADHPLLTGLEEMEVPHSRRNSLAEDDLVGAGYALLTRSGEIGVDAFAKRCPSLFVFLQGHPEYDGTSLAREFRRDLARSLSAKSRPVPAMPRRYFDERTTAALRPYLASLSQRRDPDLLRDMPEFGLLPRRQAAWQDAAARFYANWLALISGAVVDDATSRRPDREAHHSRRSRGRVEPPKGTQMETAGRSAC